MSAALAPAAGQPVPSDIAAATRGVGKTFGTTTVLSEISIAIPSGDARGLVGRNGAGKSTLVGILTGLLAPTTGTVELGGLPAPPIPNRAAWRERVACVYQRWTVIPSLSIAENLFLNDQPRTAGLIDWRRMREQARAVLLDWDIDLDPDLEAARLSVDQRQIVEIGRALLQGSRFIILDEPTAELERREIHRLFDRIRALQAAGVTFVYISHHLEELYELCRSVTVLRDGRVVADGALADIPKDMLVRAMVGSQPAGAAAPARHRETATPTEPSPVLVAKSLGLGERVQDISFSIGPGECVGLAGNATSGKEEIGEILAGLLAPDSGSVAIDGVALPFGRPRLARRRGVGYVPRDRHLRGIFPLLPIAENLTITIPEALGRLGFIGPKARASRACALMRDLAIVAASPEQPIAELSGGNQQKGIMGRALAAGPRLLVIVAPTQGVDIASKDTLFAAVARIRAAGTAVLVVSDELDELAICDRLLVLHRGRLTREFGAVRDDHAIVAAIEGLDLDPALVGGETDE